MSEKSRKPIVMVVDDSATNRFLLEVQLKDDFIIILAENGEEAIQKAIAPSTKPDIILLDIIMPEIDGYQVCSILKQNTGTEAIPIIFITSLDEAEKETHGLRMGAADYITRPFNIEIVKSRINVHLALKQNRDQLESLVQQLKDKEAYMATIMATIQNGLIISDPESRKIIDVNPFFCDMIGYEREELLGKDYHDLLGKGEKKESEDSCNSYVDHSLFQTITSEIIHTRRWFKKAMIGDKDILVQSISDITNIKELLKQQEINIFQAKRTMNVIHNKPERNIYLNKNLNLFVNYCSSPCNIEGGDHFFVKTIFSKAEQKDKTFISIKDQSGHQVGCVLRSISTDLLHNAVIHNYTSLPLDKMITQLNKEVSKSKVFALDEFFTSINLMIDHETLQLNLVSTGHSPFFRIRNQEVSILGRPGSPGTNLPIPMTDFNYESGVYELLPGDKFLLFTDGLTDVSLKSGLSELKIKELQEQLEKIIHNKPDLCITYIMRQFLSWISKKSNGRFIPQIQTNETSQLINKTEDDITAIWFEVESSKNLEEHKLKFENIQALDKFTDSFYHDVIHKCEVGGYQVSSVMFRTALTEMLLNAWKHGNKKDPMRTITVRIRFGNDLHLEVIDEGDGFDYTNLPDPTEPQNILKTSGRGIFMTRYAANEVFWKDGGRHIIAVFKHESDSSDKEVAHFNDIHLWL
ncbi:protein containing Signal transduction response regulator, receiver region [Candidatus Magnetomorum sp. HK-1]|nr:protein containing Signal transduction response regulator, receiver region [Candidatus Magnetomorum sp. HK-1]